MRNLQILIADDHEVVRRGLRWIVERQIGWEVCAEAVDGIEAAEKTARLNPDIAILDLAMPRLHGLDATRMILNHNPEQKVLVLTVFDSDALAQEVIEAGARGLLLKSDAASELVAAVEALAKGGTYFTRRVAEMVLKGFLSRSAAPQTRRPDLLTPREKEVVHILAQGKTTKEAASILGVSAKTVETHRTNVMHKLDLHSLSELVLYAVRNKIVALSTTHEEVEPAEIGPLSHECRSTETRQGTLEEGGIAGAGA